MYQVLLQALLTLIFILVISIYFLRITTVKEKLYLDKKDKATISILTLVFMLIASIHFASNFKYENSWRGEPHSFLSVEFAKPEQIRNLIFSTAVVNDDYKISFIDTSRRHLLLCDTKIGGLDACNSDSFRIHNFDLNQFKGLPLIKSIHFDIESASVDINKLLILNEKNQILENYKLYTNRKNLIPSSIKGDKYFNYFSSSNILLSRMIADEAYYVYPAYEYLNGIFPSELYHPPLGIYFISLGVFAFGVSAFAWRIMSYLFGVAIVPLIYIFTKKVTKNYFCAVAATILLISDFLHFILTRVAYLDGFVTLFLVLEYYYLYKYLESRVSGNDFSSASQNLFYSAICFSLAISCKWSGLFSIIAIVGIITYAEFIYYTPKNIFRIVITGTMLFILLPVLIYAETFLPLALMSHQFDLWSFVYQRQWLMFNNVYNKFLPSNIAAVSYYGGDSRWWGWLLNCTVMPLGGDSLQILSTNILNYINLPDKGSIVVMLNSPLISLLLPFVTIFLVYDFKINYRKNYEAWFILLTLISQYFIYIFIGRIQYIYYFYSVVPFLILGITYTIKKLLALENKYIKYLIYLYLILCVLSFIVYFPIISGYPFDRSFLYNFNAFLSVINAAFYFVLTLIIGFVLLLIKKL